MCLESTRIYEEFKNPEISLSIKYIKVKGWRDPCHYQWIIDKYQETYFEDIVTLS